MQKNNLLFCKEINCHAVILCERKYLSEISKYF